MNEEKKSSSNPLFLSVAPKHESDFKTFSCIASKRALSQKSFEPNVFSLSFSFLIHGISASVPSNGFVSQIYLHCRTAYLQYSIWSFSQRVTLLQTLACPALLYLLILFVSPSVILREIVLFYPLNVPIKSRSCQHTNILRTCMHVWLTLGTLKIRLIHMLYT